MGLNPLAGECLRLFGCLADENSFRLRPHEVEHAVAGPADELTPVDGDEKEVGVNPAFPLQTEGRVSGAPPLVPSDNGAD